MNADATLAMTENSPKDGVHLSEAHTASKRLTLEFVDLVDSLPGVGSAPSAISEVTAVRRRYETLNEVSLVPHDPPNRGSSAK